MIVLAVLLALAANAGANRAIVARIGATPIYYDSIRCDIKQLRLMGLTAPPGDTVEEQCRQIEQIRLNEQIVPPLYEAASRELHVAVPIDEVLSRLAAARLDDAAIRRLTQQAVVLPAAILEVLKGHDVHQVWQERLAGGGGMSEEAFAEIVGLVPNVAAAERMLADASFNRTKELLIAAERREMLAEKIYKATSEEAERRHVARAVFAEEFWRNVSRLAGVEIVDKRFSLPMLKEIHR